MPFSNLFRDMRSDVVTLAKRDGTRVEGIVASVQADYQHYPDMVFVYGTYPFEEGDTLEHPLPSGIVERYTILGMVFSKGVSGIPDHFQITVKKETILVPGAAPSVSDT